MKKDVLELVYRKNAYKLIKKSMEKGCISRDAYATITDQFECGCICYTNILLYEFIHLSQNPKVLEILLDEAEIKPSDEMLEKALHIASVRGKHKMVDVLLKRGVKPTLRNFEGAIFNGQEKTFHRLIRGMDLEPIRDDLLKMLADSEQILTSRCNRMVRAYLREIRAIRRMKKFMSKMGNDTWINTCKTGR